MFQNKKRRIFYFNLFLSKRSSPCCMLLATPLANVNVKSSFEPILNSCSSGIMLGKEVVSYLATQKLNYQYFRISNVT